MVQKQKEQAPPTNPVHTEKGFDWWMDYISIHANTFSS
jgi:hypothetical protein